jgi:hypothetical protein
LPKRVGGLPSGVDGLPFFASYADAAALTYERTNALRLQRTIAALA